MRRAALALCLLVLVLTEGVAFAATDYDEWVGKQIIFLAAPSSARPSTYSSFSFKDPAVERDWADYGSLAGRIGTIVSAKQKGYGTLAITLLVTVRLDDGRTVYGRAAGSLRGVAFTAELENARQYVGKTIWNNRLPYLESHDPTTGQSIKIPLENLEPLVITDVRWWISEYSPLEFVLRRQNGELVTWRGLFSTTAFCSPALKELAASKTLAANWYLTDPKELHPDWSETVWELIRQSQIAIGMTTEMVEMSWGRPEKVNRTITASSVHEQWVYEKGTYAYFEDGKLTAIQD